MANVDEQTIEGKHRILIAAGVALLVAGLVLVMFVLPAEFAVDPLGTGAKLGLMDLGLTGQQVEALTAASAERTGQATTLVPQERKFQNETLEFTLAPQEGMEFKDRLDMGEALLYSWAATGSVSFEFHAEPDGAPEGYAETYEKGQGTEASGTLTAPFAGIHGWYWENAGNQPVTLTLAAAGYYNLSHEFRAGAPVKNKIYQ